MYADTVKNLSQLNCLRTRTDNMDSFMTFYILIVSIAHARRRPRRSLRGRRLVLNPPVSTASIGGTVGTAYRSRAVRVPLRIRSTVRRFGPDRYVATGTRRLGTSVWDRVSRGIWRRASTAQPRDGPASRYSAAEQTHRSPRERIPARVLPRRAPRSDPLRGPRHQLRVCISAPDRIRRGVLGRTVCGG